MNHGPLRRAFLISSAHAVGAEAPKDGKKEQNNEQENWNGL